MSFLQRLLGGRPAPPPLGADPAAAAAEAAEALVDVQFK